MNKTFQSRNQKKPSGYLYPIQYQGQGNDWLGIGTSYVPSTAYFYLTMLPQLKSPKNWNKIKIGLADPYARLQTIIKNERTFEVIVSWTVPLGQNLPM